MQDVADRTKRFLDVPLITESDLTQLPVPVKKYLKFAGVTGNPRVENFKAIFSGSMKRSPKGKWLKIYAEQHNYYDDPARLFYIKSSLFGIPFDGYHRYAGNVAVMQIKIANLSRLSTQKVKR